MTDNVTRLPRLYDEEEAAQYLGISADRLARIRRAGEITHIVVGRSGYRYREEHLIDYLDGQTKCRGRKKKADASANTGNGTSSPATAAPTSIAPGSIPTPDARSALASAQEIFGRRSGA